MREIELTQGYKALVDDEDYSRCLHPKWVSKIDNKTVYAVRFRWIEKKRYAERLHRFVLGISDPTILVDHIDLNGLNNCKSNLRICTHSQNHANSLKRGGKTTSKFKGVSWMTRDRKWTCRIYVNKKCIHLGDFKDELQAAFVYNQAAYKYFGEFARLNVL